MSTVLRFKKPGVEVPKKKSRMASLGSDMGGFVSAYLSRGKDNGGNGGSQRRSDGEQHENLLLAQNGYLSLP